jgi:hypothetical protein
MFIPKENRIAVFSYLFKEGVVVVKKDVRSAVSTMLLCARFLSIASLTDSTVSLSNRLTLTLKDQPTWKFSCS